MRTLLLLTFITCSMACYAQRKPVPAKPTRILFVFDASRSMTARYEDATRMDGAKNLFYRFIDSLGKNKNMQFALRMYGHTVKYPPGDCKDSKLVVPFALNNLQLIKQKVTEARPTGITPIEHSLTEAANDFKDNRTTNIVIIITDGIEECGGDPCRARQKLLAKGIVFRPFIIGIGLTPEQIKTFECVGDYYDFENEQTFSQITGIIQQQKMNRTTAQVNLFNNVQQPKETNVNLTFYDVKQGSYKYNYIHTLNLRDNPDTLIIDEFPVYKVIAHTIPPRASEEVRLNPGKHTIIPIDAPQGFLRVSRREGAYNFNEKVKFMIKQSGGQSKTLNVQPLNSTEKYITGRYDIEILTLPRINLDTLLIRQSETKEIEIPSAGLLILKAPESGDGCILVNRAGKLEWVANLTAQNQQILYLQPGDYTCVWRARSLRGSIYTVEKKVRIASDMQTTIEFYK